MTAFQDPLQSGRESPGTAIQSPYTGRGSRVDWNDLGFAGVEGLGDTNVRAPTFTAKFPDGSPIELKSYGTRVFLIKNEWIDTIDNIILCSFSDLDHDIIPDIGGKAGNLPNTNGS